MKYQIDRNDERELPHDQPYWYIGIMDNRKVLRVPGPTEIVLYLEDAANTDREMEDLCARLHRSMQRQTQTEVGTVTGRIEAAPKELRLPLVGGGTLSVNTDSITCISRFNGYDNGEQTAMITLGGNSYHVVPSVSTIFRMIGTP